MAAKAGGERGGGGPEQVGELLGELREVFRVERSDVSQEGGSVAEVLGDGGVGADATDGGEIESRLLLKELQRRLELAVYQSQLRLVAFRIALHLRLQRRQAQLLRASAGRGYGFRRDAGDRVVRGHRSNLRRTETAVETGVRGG